MLCRKREQRAHPTMDQRKLGIASEAWRLTKLAGAKMTYRLTFADRNKGTKILEYVLGLNYQARDAERLK